MTKFHVLLLSVFLLTSLNSNKLWSATTPVKIVLPEIIELPQSQGAIQNKLISIQKAKNSVDWNKFIDENGNWNVMIDRLTGTPTSAYGKSIVIDGYESLTDNNIYEASEKFITKYSALLGVNPAQLDRMRATHRGNRWYVTYGQKIEGLYVYGSRFDLRIFDGGKVAAFYSGFYPEANVDLTNIKSLNEVRANSLNGLSPKSSNHDELSDGKLWIVPLKSGETIQYRPAYKIYVNLYDEMKKYIVFVDAGNGEVLMRNSIVYSIETQVSLSGNIKYRDPSEQDSLVMFENQLLQVGNNSFFTGNLGSIQMNLPGNSSFTYNFDSKYSDVRDAASDLAPNSSFNLLSGSDNPLLLDNSNSKIEERTLTYHANLMHLFYWNLDSTVDVAKIKSHIYLDWSDNAPNAYSNLDTIVFVSLGYPDVRMGQSSQVLCHEYGHTYNNLFYQELSNHSLDGLNNASIHEGMADVSSAMIWDTPQVGRGVFLADKDSVIRTLENKNHYPEDIQSDSHYNGLIIGGAYWDLRTYSSIDYLRKIVQKVRYGLPDDDNFGLACYKFFTETLFADDDDGNLDNGTPNFDKICKAFDNHGIGLNLFAQINFQYKQEKFIIAESDSFAIKFKAKTKIGTYNFSDIKVVYSTDEFATTKDLQAENLSGDNFSVTIPALKTGSIVKFYFVINDPSNNTQMKFTSRYDMFSPFCYGVNYAPKYSLLENNAEWNVDKSAGNATQGFWLWTKALEVKFGDIILQPGNTVSGNSCFVSGAFNNQNIYQSFPNGTVVLTSPEYSLDAEKLYWVKFNSYLSSLQFASVAPSYKLYASVNGTSQKTEIYNLSEIKSDWLTFNLDLRRKFGSINTIKFYVVLSVPAMQGTPYNLSSLTKALMDDFIVYESQSPAGINDEKTENKSIVVLPNPFNTQTDIICNIPANQNLISAGIYNLRGELVKSFIVSPGQTKINWDGTDNRGAKSAGGKYFVKLTSQDKVYTISIIKE